jgi:rfaE bifunctional protein nucleotidyltransferase chain/domain
MNKILSLDDISETAKELHEHGKTIVLVGGGFDILHRGHITFLESANREGDVLFVLLESDESLKAHKGKSRPVNTQADRAKILASLLSVDYIIPLTGILSSAEYDTIVLRIKPAIIATTKGDPGRIHKERQAQLIGGVVKDVTDRLPDYASSRLAENITEL